MTSDKEEIFKSIWEKVRSDLSAGVGTFPLKMSKVTFVVSGTVPERLPEIVSLSNHPIIKETKGRILSTIGPENCFAPPFSNGFVGTAFMAYNKHHHLTLRPDDVWSAIMIAFSEYVNSHSQEMRSLFVDFEGKRELTARADGTIQRIPWGVLVPQLTQQIDENLKKGIKDWVIPDFTTTNQWDRVVGGITLMGAMKNYFSYGMNLSCGLPGVTLEGTLEDWESLRKKIDPLLDFSREDLKKWHSLMVPVLDKFVESYQKAAQQEKVDTLFWNRICNYISGGSGPRYISGWINVFIPFRDGKFIILEKTWRGHTSEWGYIDTNRIPSSMVSVPLKINDNGREYKTLLYAGSIMGQYNRETNEVRPSVDLVLIDVT